MRSTVSVREGQGVVLLCGPRHTLEVTSAMFLLLIFIK